MVHRVTIFGWRGAGLLAAVGLCLGTASTSLEGRQAGQPNFEATGLQPQRSYFSQLPFESVDMVNGNLLLSFTDWSCRATPAWTYNSSGPTTTTLPCASGEFDFAGVPLRVGLPDGPPPNAVLRLSTAVYG